MTGSKLGIMFRDASYSITMAIEELLSSLLGISKEKFEKMVNEAFEELDRYNAYGNFHTITATRDLDQVA